MKTNGESATLHTCLVEFMTLMQKSSAPPTLPTPTPTPTPTQAVTAWAVHRGLLLVMTLACCRSCAKQVLGILRRAKHLLSVTGVAIHASHQSAAPLCIDLPFCDTCWHCCQWPSYAQQCTHIHLQHQLIRTSSKHACRTILSL